MWTHILGGLKAIDFDANDTLAYGILIQNNGTSSAYDIRLNANLSPKMTSGSLCVVASDSSSIPYNGILFYLQREFQLIF